jgi:hypothetical protein
VDLLLSVSMCLSIPLNAFALCNEPPRPCTWYAVHHGQPTFIGRAVSEESVPDVLELGRRDVQVTVQRVIFNVEEPFDGAPKDMETVYGEGTSNDSHFKVGERYLVYGWREKDGKIRTAKCTRTAPVSEAAEDIRFLHSLSAQQGGSLRTCSLCESRCSDRDRSRDDYGVWNRWRAQIARVRFRLIRSEGACSRRLP